MNRDYITNEHVEEERYELQVGPCYRFSPNRREFVAVVGAGLLISVSTAGARAQQRGGRRGGQQTEPTNLSERIHIGQDGIVTVMTGKVEVGQDART